MNASPPVPALVSELLSSDISQSLDFWCRLCGFQIEYERPDEGFAYLSLASAHLMLGSRTLA